MTPPLLHGRSDAGFGWITGPPEFGGRGLDVIYVTSLQKSGEEPDPLAGCLFAITGTGVTGMEVPPFAG